MNTKKIIAGFTIILMIFGTAIISHAGDRFRQRQKKQSNRIYHGIKTGRITKGEYNRLNREQNRIDRAYKRAIRDGYINRYERKRLNRMQKRANQHIYDKKHNSRNTHRRGYYDRHRHRVRRSHNIYHPKLRIIASPVVIFPVIY